MRRYITDITNLWLSKFKRLSIKEKILLLLQMISFVLPPRLWNNLLLDTDEGNQSSLFAGLYFICCRIIYALVVPFVYIAYKERIMPSNYRRNIICLMLSLWMSLVCTIGYSFSEVGSWDICFKTTNSFIIWTWQIVAFTFFFYYALSLLYEWLDNSQESKCPQKKVNYKKIFFYIFLFFLPYWVLLWPGVFQWDSFFLVQEYFDGRLDNHNPIIYQFFWGELMKLGIGIGHPEVLFSFLSLIQIVFFSGLITASVYALYEYVGIGWRKIKWTILFYAMNPIYAISCVQIIKDFYFSFVIFAYLLLLFYLIKVNKTICGNKKIFFLHVLLVGLLCLTKNQGIYIVEVMMIVLLFLYRKNWIRVICIYLPVIFIYHVFLLNFIFPKYNVDQSTRRQESIGWMLQATARYVRDFPNDVHENEKSVISRILVYDSLATHYELECSDGIKGSAMRPGLFRKDCTVEDLKDYYIIWLTMGLRHPSAYMQSTIGTSYINLYYMQSYPEQYTPKPDREPILIQNPMRVVSSTMVAHVFNRIPIIGKIVNTPTYVWAYVIILFYFLYRKRWHDIAWTFPLTLVALVLLVSPCGGFRYSEPIVWIVPFIFMVAIGKNERIYVRD